jgi:hypothetical protein
MPQRPRANASNHPLQGIDPRHSLVARIIWLVVALAASFALAASVWVGGVAREIVVQQHLRRLALESDQLASRRCMTRPTGAPAPQPSIAWQRARACTGSPWPAPTGVSSPATARLRQEAT